MVDHISKYSKSNYDHGQTPLDQQNNMWKIELEKLSMFPNVIKIEFIGYWTKVRWVEPVSPIDLWESFVLTGYGSCNSKWTQSYGWPNNPRLLGATSKSWGATSVWKSKIALYDFWKLVHGYEIEM